MLAPNSTLNDVTLIVLEPTLVRYIHESRISSQHTIASLISDCDVDNLCRSCSNTLFEHAH